MLNQALPPSPPLWGLSTVSSSHQDFQWDFIQSYLAVFESVYHQICLRILRIKYNHLQKSQGPKLAQQEELSNRTS